MYISEPQLQVRNNCLLLYHLPTVTPPRGPVKFDQKAYSGKMTYGSKKRILSAIDILLQCNKPKPTYNPVTGKTFPFQCSFVTLTISNPKPLGSQFCHKYLMKPFLRKLKTFGNLSYVWKLEYQSDTDYHGKAKRYGGQLHYHLATNLFVPWQDIRSTWNNIQRKARLLDEFAERHKHFDPNSTDIHSMYQVNDVGAYMAEYFKKNGSKPVHGKIWDCSTDLKRKRFTFTPTNQQEMSLRQLQNDRHAKVIELERCTIFKIKNPLSILTANQLTAYLLWKQ